MTKIIGLTGGIGSGKTMIANYIQSKGVPVYIADDEAKKIMKAAEVKELICSEFGDAVLKNDIIDNSMLAQLVFNNPDKLQKLNGIVHPLVASHFEEWLKKHNDFPFIIKEAAILFESGSFKNCDAIITVIAPLETRIRRILKRDETTREGILQRIQSQWSDEEKMSKSDFVIQNSTRKDTINQVDEILKKLYNL
jgi:dephospho-CoA kinase